MMFVLLLPYKPLCADWLNFFYGWKTYSSVHRARVHSQSVFYTSKAFLMHRVVTSTVSTKLGTEYSA